MVRFIAVDDNGQITGSVAKPAIEAVAKPLVDAAEARLTPKPILKNAAIQAANANGAADGPTKLLIRIPVTVAQKVTRWRIRLKNAGATATGSGNLTSVGVYHAKTPATDKHFLAAPVTRPIPDFTITGGTEYVSPWVSTTTAAMGSGVEYSVSFVVSGTNAMVMGDALIPIYTSTSGANGGDQGVVPTRATRVPLAITVEYEAEYAQGAVAQGGIMQVTREEYLAARTAGTLDSGVFYAVTESV